MTNKISLTTVTALIFLGYAPEVATASATVCMERKIMVEYLQKEHDEVSVSYGLLMDGLLFEILASPKGTWTVLLSHSAGKSCIYASGVDWSNPPKLVPEPDGEIIH